MANIQIHVFISHSWTYHSHYDKLSSWIFETKWKEGINPIIFCDYSVPKDDPIHKVSSSSQLKNKIYAQIA